MSDTLSSTAADYVAAMQRLLESKERGDEPDAKDLSLVRELDDALAKETVHRDFGDPDSPELAASREVILKILPTFAHEGDDVRLTLARLWSITEELVALSQ